ncbi:hypothetical protein GCM10010250_25970 [Streptomyces althioticus]|nr:hypothetical protein GCM10010250_25970 [Streptomyces althioticus]
MPKFPRGEFLSFRVALSYASPWGRLRVELGGSEWALATPDAPEREGPKLPGGNREEEA